MCNNGGIKIGINAMCTGIKFCESIAITVKITKRMNLLFLIIEPIFFAKTVASPV